MGDAVMVKATASKRKAPARKEKAGKVGNGNYAADAIARACSDRYADPGEFGKGLATFEQTGGDKGPRWQQVLLLTGCIELDLLDGDGELPRLSTEDRSKAYAAADKALVARDVQRIGPLYTRRGRAYSLFFPADADPADLPNRRSGPMKVAAMRDALQV